MTLDSVREAVFQVSPVTKLLSFTNGYTPAQWVSNSNPRDPTVASADNFNPTCHHDALSEQDFAAELGRRVSARTALMRADADARLTLTCD